MPDIFGVPLHPDKFSTWVLPSIFRFPDEVKLYELSITADFGMQEGDPCEYNFGHHEGDPGEDVLDFIWHMWYVSWP